VKDENEIQTSETAASVPTDWLWWASVAGITAIAACLRFVALTLKPLHHDEGVNGFFLTDLFRKG
jgi:predicted membrane-bound mannosyltransferase